ncbi:hypothetical protein [Amycolatopsis sp. NPDC004079]|uniref:hypothetical protein n=1 Tax=Amycolatopsis sp. NPDC004079 TaxID=3154549 RepID=UPI0033B9D382
MSNSRVRRLAAAVVLAALTVTTGVAAPAVATAAPIAAVAQTPEEVRTNAAAVVGLAITPEMLRLSESDFVHEIYLAAQRQGDVAEEVQWEADYAYSHGTTSLFLATRIYLAHQRDLDREALYQVRRTERQPAAALLGLELTRMLLSQEDPNFVFALWEHAPRDSFVRAAAAAAVKGTPEEKKEFIVHGIFVEHQRDVEAAKEAAEKEAAEKKLRDARVKAAAAVGMDAALAAQLTDDQFVWHIWARQAPYGSEMWIAAYSCETPEQRRAFIDTGIFEAAAKDKLNDMKARAAAVVGVEAGYARYLEEGPLVREIWTRSTPGSHVQAAARRAMDSQSPAEWRAFLETGIFVAQAADKS